mmetsp:Transcript_20054/g.28816  ORF Transcript_20054/g.28816 Transcript_20054/m.28816 type:complete len:415 (+) Transcript_20054:111-1355(+)|eukprot:CAMPEP_0185018282 /NCGR_PEP_ID=MMETSP1103-20130426/1054_1 /TAXON_ID=36769 /ORGANISM="Paraphysomonas bandaiensis, Strain Caron Lab Isolate" /LENGTH=414 /DNA_ID=CAMNT_0027548037 /DNA_START=94 /DNA_END=1338 /DNA_ORIENTATION=+
MSQEQKESLNEPAKLLLLAALLAKDHIISNNAKAFLKELILRRDTRIIQLLKKFESKEAGDTTFLDHIHDLIEDEAHAVFNELFSDTSLEVGKTLSKEERDQKSLQDEKSLIYGEVDFHSFYRVLRKINPSPGGVFYDLGSGTGKAVFAARFVCDFSRCIGIEVLESLHQQAAGIVHRYNEDFQEYLTAGMHQMANVYAGSFLDYDWSDGDVVFANSTCYDDQLMADMGEMAKSLKPGAIFVTFTKGLNLPDFFELVERKRYRMSWGPATVFIHRRLGDDGRPCGPFKLNLLPSDDKNYSDDEGGNKWSNDEDDEEESDDDYEDDYEDEDDGIEAEDEEEDEPYAPQRSYYDTSSSSNNGTAAANPLELKVTPLMKFQQRQAATAGLPSGLGSPQDVALLRRKNRSAANRSSNM